MVRWGLARAGFGAALAVGGAVWLGWVAPGRFVHDAELLALPLQQGLILLGAVRRSWQVGKDDLRAGLGWLPVRRRWLVAGLVGRTPLVPVIHQELAGASPGLDGLRPGAALYAAWVVGALVVGALVLEELFFRGWLWVGLRRRWGAWRTGLMTGLVFLLLHGVGGGWRQLALLAPVVVPLSVAREVGGSVKAPPVIHVFNNGLAVAGAGWLGDGTTSQDRVRPMGGWKGRP